MRDKNGREHITGARNKSVCVQSDIMERNSEAKNREECASGKEREEEGDRTQDGSIKRRKEKGRQQSTH